MGIKKTGRKTNNDKGMELAVNKNIKFKPSEWEYVQVQAKKEGMTVSAYVKREVLKGYVPKVKITEAERDILLKNLFTPEFAHLTFEERAVRHAEIMAM